jgi:hypothetical protein
MVEALLRPVSSRVQEGDRGSQAAADPRGCQQARGVYVCVCVYAYICVCMYIYTSVCVCVYVYVYICVYVCICMCVNMYVYLYANCLHG